MPCKKCGNLIGKKINVGEKEVNVSTTRKYCFDCVPLYSNQKRLQCKENEVIRKCVSCKKDFCSARNRTICNSCNVNNRRFLKKQFCLNYKGNKCQNCGYDKCFAALTFHHRNPKDKLFTISGSHARSKESLMKELDKCDLLCHNCHVELHMKEESRYFQEMDEQIMYYI